MLKASSHFSTLHGDERDEAAGQMLFRVGQKPDHKASTPDDPVNTLLLVMVAEVWTFYSESLMGSRENIFLVDQKLEVAWILSRPYLISL